MLVKELIKKLKKFPPNHLVLCSSDEEGNSFFPLSDDIETTAWYEENQEVVDEEGAPDFETNAIILWP